MTMIDNKTLIIASENLCANLAIIGDGYTIRDCNLSQRKAHTAICEVVEAIQLVRGTSGPLVVQGAGETLEQGLARANTVLGYLLEYGVAGDRLRAESVVSSTDKVTIKNDVQTNWK